MNLIELAGQNVLVLGLGLSGRSAANFCAKQGAQVLAVDERPEDKMPPLSGLSNEIEVRLGMPFPDLSGYDLVVPSPGIPAARWQDSSQKAWGDIELCYRALSIPIIAVTGTNGKSTVVRMIESMARAAGLRARAAGNVGIPALELVGAPLDLAILEVSSFQLESTDKFRPRVSVLLNLSPDHFDRHRDLEGYLAAKKRIFARQGAGDSAILNGDESRVRDVPLPAGVERLLFERHSSADDGAFMDGEKGFVRRGGSQQIVDLSGISPACAGQRENLLAALLALAAIEVDLELAAQALVGFEGLPHRCETVAEIRGVRYVDDSKATNIGAAMHALETTSGPIIWIVGGRHKGGVLKTLADHAKAHVRHALLIGEAESEFEAAFEGLIPCECVGNIKNAVAKAAKIATSGNVVLLAPACASFDQFESFEERGRCFQAAVQALESSEVRQ
jgi:UDP-N-acetylmuramoylalanine--D-glutamate ligase